MTEPSQTLTKVGDVRPSGLLLNLAAIPLMMIFVVGLLWLAKAMPGAPASGPTDLFWVLPAVGLLLILHELTHAAAFKLLADLPWRTFKFGFNPKALVVYCYCPVPVTVAVYRWAALAPLLVLGTLSVLALLIYPAEWLAVLTGLHLAACIGDVWIVAGLRKFASDLLVRDHPTDPGCEIFAPFTSTG
jgi:hypothetical protein